jgi:hypothetical protein
MSVIVNVFVRGTPSTGGVETADSPWPFATAQVWHRGCVTPLLDSAFGLTVEGRVVAFSRTLNSPNRLDGSQQRLGQHGLSLALSTLMPVRRSIAT